MAYQPPPAVVYGQPTPYQGANENSSLLAKEEENENSKPRSWMDVPDNVDYKQQTPEDIRSAFIAKVYSLLSVQLGITALVCCIFMFTPSLRTFLLQHTWLIWVEFIISIGLLIALHFKARDHPVNLILLHCFTLCMSFMVAISCSLYAQQNMVGIVAMAFGITLLVFVALTIFVVVSKRDFDFLGPFLFAGLLIMIVWGLISMIIGIYLRFVYAAIGAVLFAGFIIYDTHMLMKRLGCDDYVFATISLYLDILNLFLFILELLGGGRR